MERLPNKVDNSLRNLQPFCAGQSFWVIIWFLIVGFVLADALYLRIGYLDLIEFKRDEFEAIKLSYQNLHVRPALVGLMSSRGLYNPPFFIYLISIPVSVSTDPQFVTSFVIFINVLALWLLYLLVRKVFSVRFAWVVCLLIATSPWAIIFSRKIWAQDFLLPFLIVFYLSLVSHLNRPASGKIWLMAGLFAVITQLHMSAWFLFVPLIIFIVMMKVSVSYRDIFIGGMIFALLYLPYIVFHITTDFQNLQAFLSVDRPAIWSHTNVNAMIGNIKWTYNITSGIGLRYLFGGEYEQFVQSHNIIWTYIFSSTMLVVAILGILWALSLLARGFGSQVSFQGMELSEKVLVLFALIIVFIHFGYFVMRVPSFPHYSIVTHPILVVFAAKYGLQLYDQISSATFKNVCVRCFY